MRVTFKAKNHSFGDLRAIPCGIVQKHPTPQTHTMKNEIIKNAAAITVINDGQFRYPVMTESLKSWVDSHGAITSANYDQFCADVDCIGEAEVGTPGNVGMIELCRELIEAGAEGKTL